MMVFILVVIERILFFAAMIGMLVLIPWGCWVITDGYLYLNPPVRGPAHVELWWQRKPFRTVVLLSAIEVALILLCALVMLQLPA